MRKAFTLIELLVVISIIALIISILLPSLSHAREQSRSAVCQSSLRQFGIGITQFALEHKNHMPGVYTWETEGLQDWQRDWLSGTYGSKSELDFSFLGVYENAPESGTLFPYVGESKKIYRCPSLPVGQLLSGKDSNGKYDYTMIGGFGGADIDRLPRAVYKKKIKRTTVADDTRLKEYPFVSPAPFFIEESPSKNLNSTALAGSFALNDVLGSQHNENSNYVATDGSSHRFTNDFKQATGYELYAPGWRMISEEFGINIGKDAVVFDMWNYLNSNTR